MSKNEKLGLILIVSAIVTTPTDEPLVLKLDRLGRSTRDVLNPVHDLEAKGSALTVPKPAFSTKDAAGPILMTVLSADQENSDVIFGKVIAGKPPSNARARAVYLANVERKRFNPIPHLGDADQPRNSLDGRPIWPIST